jgi:hypothetical protein
MNRPVRICSLHHDFCRCHLMEQRFGYQAGNMKTQKLGSFSSTGLPCMSRAFQTDGILASSSSSCSHSSQNKPAHHNLKLLSTHRSESERIIIRSHHAHRERTSADAIMVDGANAAVHRRRAKRAQEASESIRRRFKTMLVMIANRQRRRSALRGSQSFLDHASPPKDDST